MAKYFLPNGIIEYQEQYTLKNENISILLDGYVFGTNI